MKNNKKLTILTLMLFSIVCLNIGCKKLVEVQTPDTKILKTSVYSTDQSAIAVLNNILAEFNPYGLASFNFNGIILTNGLLADELTLVDVSLPDLTLYYQNNLSPGSTNIYNSYWAKFYQIIFQTNDAIEGLSQSISLSTSIKNQLLGEAKFLRAYCYFYLTNLYGDVALPLSTDYKITSQLPRIKQSEIFDQIINDLTEAKSLLNENFLDGTLQKTSSDRVRPTKWAASSFLAKVALYTSNWKLAEDESNEVIANSNQFGLDSLNAVFLKNSREAIWQTQPTTDIYNTEYAVFFIIPEGSAPNYFQPTTLSPSLLNAFEDGDMRRNKWIDSTTDLYSGVTYYFPYKYKNNASININTPLTEYNMMFRLGEQYLIRAESRAQQNNLSGALSDLKIIRNRANLLESNAKTKEQIINAILHERQVELFTEWGDRWFDLRRMNKIDQVMHDVSIEKGGTWSNYKKYLPIDNGERFANSNLDQTPGY